jgi:hypothetical protein
MTTVRSSLMIDGLNDGRPYIIIYTSTAVLFFISGFFYLFYFIS